MTGQRPDWADVDVEAVQNRLAERLGLILQDDEDLITLVSACAFDLYAQGELFGGQSLRDVRESVRDWLES